MTAEELAANQGAADHVTDPVARDVARWASSRQLTPGTVAAIALGFGVIAATWLTVSSVRAEMIAFAALLAAFVAGRAARLMSAEDLTAATYWSVAACAVLTELAVYAGIAGAVSAHAATSADAGLSGPAGSRMDHTFLASFGGPGAVGVWRLAVAAAIALAVVQLAGICQAARGGQQAGSHWFQAIAVAPAGARLLLTGAVVVLAGARAAFLFLIAAGVLAFVAVLVRGPGAEPTEEAGWLPACRGDGPLAAWIGRLVGGRLPPLPPLIVGLLVTGSLAMLGLHNLPGILLLTPVEAMLLTALASWHPHDGSHDWLVPPLLVAGECIFIAAAGFAGRAWAPVTFALIAAVGLRHLDLAYRARNQVPPGQFGRFVTRKGRLPYTDRRGFGWEGRMLVAGVAVVTGIAPYVFPVLAAYLLALLARDFAVGWLAGNSAGHAAVDG
jgi:Family of unknown function (DUF5941)